MKILRAMSVALLMLASCHKTASLNVSGSDDEVIDQYSAQLEEFHSQSSVADYDCRNFCKYKDKVCGISKATCDVSIRLSDRTDLQTKCVSAQEECARFNDACSSCKL